MVLTLARLGAVAIGLVLLARAADRFVVGAAELAKRLGIPRVVIGAVVVGFGTSAPEMLVSGVAAARGDADVGLGNAIGSNLANLTLVLGIAGLVGVVRAESGVIRREAPVTLGAMALFAALVPGGLSAPEGAVLAGALLAVLVVVVVSARRNGSRPLATDVDELLEGERRRPLIGVVVLTLGGLAGTLVGAQLLVWAAVGLAASAGLSGGFVGMTLVAVGTSLPEIVTCVQAARRDETDLILGNLLGSNVFNSLAVGATIAFLAPGARIDARSQGLGLVAMMVAGVAAIIAIGRGQRLTRGEAVALVVGYAAVVPLLA